MLVVVGGHSRNIGKTSVVAGLIRKLRDRQWTAVKITQYGQSTCLHGEHHCGCEAGPGQAFALTEEHEPNRSDSGRFLAAGAERSFWLRTPAGELARASRALEEILGQSRDTIVESNSVLAVLEPDVFLMVLDFSRTDFKASSLQFVDRADAFVVIDRGMNVPLWDAMARGVWDRKPRFLVKPPNYVTPAVAEFVRGRLSAALH